MIRLAYRYRGKTTVRKSRKMFDKQSHTIMLKTCTIQAIPFRIWGKYCSCILKIINTCVYIIEERKEVL